MHFPEAVVTSEHRPHLAHHGDLKTKRQNKSDERAELDPLQHEQELYSEETHLHLKLKVLVLPLPAQNIARDANFHGLLKAVGAHPDRTGDQALHRKSQGTERRKRRRLRKKL